MKTLVVIVLALATVTLAYGQNYKDELLRYAVEPCKKYIKENFGSDSAALKELEDREDEIIASYETFTDLDRDTRMEIYKAAKEICIASSANK